MEPREPESNQPKGPVDETQSDGTVVPPAGAGGADGAVDATEAASAQDGRGATEAAAGSAAERDETAALDAESTGERETATAPPDAAADASAASGTCASEALYGRKRIGWLPPVLAVAGGALLGIGLLILVCAMFGGVDRMQLIQAAAGFLIPGFALAYGAVRFLHVREKEVRETAYRTAFEAASRPSACQLAAAASAENAPAPDASTNETPTIRPSHVPQMSGPPSGMRPELGSNRGPAASKATGSPSSSDLLERLLAHSDDLFATLRSLLQSGGSDSDFRILTSLLSVTDIADWTDAPKVGCRRLSRNGCYWIAADADSLFEDDYDRLMQAEFALNLARRMGSTSQDDEPEAIRRRAATLVARAPFGKHPTQGAGAQATDFIKGVYAHPSQVVSRSEWVQRIMLSEAAENAAPPFRLNFDFRADAESGLMFIELEIPRPLCFAVVADSQDVRIKDARSYALKAALFMASVAFDAPPTQRVVVTCHAHGSSRALVSLDMRQEDCDRLLEGVALGQESFDDPVVRVRFDDDGWFAPVEPHLRRNAPELHPERYTFACEMNGDPCPERLRKASGARVVSDFGISEDAERQQVWKDFADEAPSSIEGAVTRLIALRDTSERRETRDACDRLIRALVEGMADISDESGMRRCFFWIDDLDEALDYARMIVTGAEREDVERAVERLESALSGSRQFAYLDDTDAVYRYFGSVAERVYYNRTYGPDAPDGQADSREVRLVPDAYYTAQEVTARLLLLLGRNDEALRHADEAMRLAPVSTDAGLIKARVLENQSDLFGAAELVKELIPRALSKHETAICLYRLAFFEWKLGHEDLSLACYQVAIGLHATISAQAAIELAELLAANEGLKPLTSVRARARLREEGIILGCRQETREWVGSCAVLCVDGGLYAVAASLTGTLVELMRDDALVDVYRSLLPAPEA